MIFFMKTLIIGASTDPSRYAFLAANRLLEKGHEIVLIGRHEGEIKGNLIHTQQKNFEKVDTITLYINPKNQAEYYDYILNMKPRRVIFNPGTENQAFQAMLEKNNIEPIEACTLVMLSTKEY
jgi:predicted CoA-binding protein